MAASEKSKHLKLKVANFGPIAKAEIDLRPMTVFVGPSNTGKSYLAMLIYALHRFFSGESIIQFSSRGRFVLPSSLWPRIWYRWGDDDTDLSDGEIDDLVKWIKQGDTENPIPDSIAAQIRHRLRDVGFFGDRFSEDLARCFGIEDTKDLIRHGSAKGARVDLDWPDPQLLNYNFTLNGDGIRFDSSVPSTLPLSPGSFDIKDAGRVYSISREYEGGEFGREYVHPVMNALSEAVSSRIVGLLVHPAYYLPADRTGVMHAHRVVVGSLIARASRAGLARSPTEPALSGVLADFLGWLIDLPTQQPRSRGDRELSDRLEREMLQGAIVREDSAIGYPEFYYRPDGWGRDIPLMNSSSMVSELAPVVLYLRHIVNEEEGDVLIIEEPEAHLHPAMQVKFVRLLAAAVNDGIRVILTTHSEWVLEELANLVQLSKLPEPSRKQFKGPDSALDPDQLGVWLFETKKSPKGTVVREIPLDFEIGNFPSGYDGVAMDAYNRWVRISNLVGESKS